MVGEGRKLSLQRKNAGAASQQEATAAVVLSHTSSACSRIIHVTQTQHASLTRLCRVRLSFLESAESGPFVGSRFKRRYCSNIHRHSSSLFCFLQPARRSHKLSCLHLCSSQPKTNIPGLSAAEGRWKDVHEPPWVREHENLLNASWLWNVIQRDDRTRCSREGEKRWGSGGAREPGRKRGGEKELVDNGGEEDETKRRNVNE